MAFSTYEQHLYMYHMNEFIYNYNCYLNNKSLVDECLYNLIRSIKDVYRLHGEI